MPSLFSTITIALFATCVSSQSVLFCLDNGGGDLNSPASQNPCIGYPRGREKYEIDGDKAIIRKMSSDLSCGVPFGTKYSVQYPSTYLVAGSSFYPEFAARNYAGKEGKVQFYLSQVNAVSDPSPTEFEQQLICELSFSDCNNNLGSYDAPCTGVCNIPKDTAPGTYVIQWRFEASDSEVYSACADVEILAEKEQRCCKAATTTTTKASTTTASTASSASTTSTSKATTSQSISPSSTTAVSAGSGSTGLQGDSSNNSANSSKKDNWWTLGGILTVVFGGLFAITLAGLIALYVTKVRKPVDSPATDAEEYPPAPSREISSPPANA